MDAQVARRTDKRLSGLLDRFVCVRAVEMEGVDLSLFQFDYDQTWTAFMLNADRTIYGRYGTRASGSADLGVDVSIEGFAKALEGALEIHAAYPGNRASLAGKRADPPPEKEIREFSGFKARFAGDPPKNCAHCHHVWEALRSVPRGDRKPLPDSLMWPYPKPDRIGLTLDLDERATVKAVAVGSAAAAAGFAAGDRILTLERQPIVSVADVQWVLHHADPPCDLTADVERDGERRTLTLRLAEGWRRGEDVTWRASTHAMRPFGWLPATPEQRRALKVKDGVLCVRVNNVPGSGVAQRAGLAAGDFVLEIDGSDRAVTENEWLEFLAQKKVRGQTVALTILHGGRRDKVKLQVQ